MTDRERTLAVLRYESYDRLPVVHFGYWRETLDKWAREGHVSEDEAKNWGDGNLVDRIISGRLGFDFNYACSFGGDSHLRPPMEERVLEELPDGSKKILNGNGVIILEKPGVTSIPTEFDHLLKTRKEWEEHFKWRLRFTPDRVNEARVLAGDRYVRFDKGGSEFLANEEREYLYGIGCGSMFGTIRNMVGVAGSSYIYAEDEALFDEIIEVRADLSFQCVKTILDTGARFDFGHYWEDICFKNGPLIIPSVFEEKVGPQYRRINDLLRSHGIDLVSVDCDGKIDALIPGWLDNGVNVMFPIEVGTWNASIEPWRKEYGRELRGVGGMDKRAFSQDRAAVDAEIERLRPLVDLGGYIPCPDHRIAPDAKWDNVRYYCERMREVFG